MRLEQPTAAAVYRQLVIHDGSSHKACMYIQSWFLGAYLDCCAEGGIIDISVASSAVQLVVLKVHCKLMACMHRSGPDICYLTDKCSIIAVCAAAESLSEVQ